MKRAMRKNTLGKSVDTICGRVKGKKASGEGGDWPYLYLVTEDEAYVVNGPANSAAASAYRNICNEPGTTELSPATRCKGSEGSLTAVFARADPCKASTRACPGGERAPTILWLASRMDPALRRGAGVLFRAGPRAIGVAGCALSARAYQCGPVVHAKVTQSREMMRCCHSGARVARTRNPSGRKLCWQMDSGLVLRTPGMTVGGTDPARKSSARSIEICSKYQRDLGDPASSDKIFPFCSFPNRFMLRPVPPGKRGARDRHERAVGCGGREWRS